MNSIATDEKHELEIVCVSLEVAQLLMSTDQSTCIDMMTTPRATCWCFSTCFPTELILGTMCQPALEENVQMIFVSGSTIERDVDLG